MPEVSAVGFDIAVRHAVMLERLKANEALKMLPMYQELDKALRARLSTSELTTWSRKRLERLLTVVDENLDDIISKAEKEFGKGLRELAKFESRFESESLTQSVQNKAFEATTPSPRQAWAAATANPLTVRGVAGGQLLEGFIDNWSDKQRQMMVSRIRRGVFEGETNGQILRGIRGTVGGRFREGILGQSYRQSQAMVRTAVQHVSHQARLATFQANSDLVTGYRWLSTLDNRTSEICQALSGEVFKLDDGGPLPPAHVNCRSTIVAELDEDFDFLKEGRTQSSQFGPVDANETYYSWLKQQPAGFQNEVLGKVKATLFRDGGLSVEEFQKLVRADNYTPLTLARMQELKPLAFQKAGIRITDAGRAVLGQAVGNAPAAIASPPPTTPRPRARASTAEEIDGPDPLWIGRGKAVTNADLTKALQAVGTKEAEKVIAILSARKTGTVFQMKTRATYAGWRKFKSDPTNNDAWVRFVEGTGRASDGSKGILQAEPVARKTKGVSGFTSWIRNYVIVFQQRGFRGFGKLDKKKLRTVFENVISRRDKPFWNPRSGRWPNDTERAWSFSGQASTRGGFAYGPDHEMFLTWIHEIGHQVDYRYQARFGGRRIPKERVRLTEYSASNDKEWFAEHFVAWVLNRRALLKIDAEAVKIIEDAVAEALRVLPEHLR
jgi:SPP1 gp7 family putative phage head morphogenesis protein